MSAPAFSPALFLGVALLLAALSGIPLLLPQVPEKVGQRLAAGIMVTASLCGMIGAGVVLLSGNSYLYVIDWSLPFDAAEVGCDPLSAFFLLPVFLVFGCSSVYALGYWPPGEHPRTVRRLTLFSGMLCAAIVALLLARNGVLFLIAWEVMALASFFTLTTEHQRQEVRDAGLLYLVTTHTGTLVLFAHFALLKSHTATYAFPGAGTLDGALLPATVLFLTALIGFGLKAGIMPLHIWLPSVHAAAPSHISAVMSGVLIKTGIYGIIRVSSFFHTPPAWWGMLVLVVGIISAVIGVLFAIGQHDLKRLLAYHSIENIGIIAMGVGVALLGRSSGNQALVILGMGGALLHVLNHGIFKGLLFLGAGSAIHASGTREIDRMGGLAKGLPLTAFFFVIGAAAICGLPPLNGFVSEFFIYLGLFRGVIATGAATVPGVAFLVLAIPALALVGGLAAACFVKAYGVVFLGASRRPDAPEPHEAGPAMLIPMGVLALLCVIIGIFPQGATRLLEPAVAAWGPAGTSSGVALAALAPLGWLTVMGIALVIFGLIVAVIALKRRDGGVTSTGTWDCGYLKPTARMQYTASSFAEMIVGLFDGILRPGRHEPKIVGPFPQPSRFSSHVPEAVLELVYLPLLKRADHLLLPLRKLQHGQIPIYILYIFVTVIVLLALAP